MLLGLGSWGQGSGFGARAGKQRTPRTHMVHRASIAGIAVVAGVSIPICTFLIPLFGASRKQMSQDLSSPIAGSPQLRSL